MYVVLILTCNSTLSIEKVGGPAKASIHTMVKTNFYHVCSDVCKGFATESNGRPSNSTLKFCSSLQNRNKYSLSYLYERP